MTQSGNAKGVAGVALVTGGAHRLGRELAQALGAAGYAVAVAFRSDPAKAEQTVRDLQGGRRRRRGASAPTSPPTRGRAVSSPTSSGASGGSTSSSTRPRRWITKPVAAVTIADWEAVFRTGPRAAFFLAQAAADALRGARGRSS